MIGSAKEEEGRLRMSDGFGLFYRRWGAVGGAKRILLCIHGIELHSGAFRFMGERLASGGNEVYAIDVRGFGNSVEEGLERVDTRDFERQLKDLEECAKHLRNSHPDLRLFVFGHSLGCAYTLWLTASHPELVDGIILAAPVVKPKFEIGPLDLLKIAVFASLSPRKRYDFLSTWPKEFREGEEYKIDMQDPLCPKTYGTGWLFTVSRRLTGKTLSLAAKVQKAALVLRGGQDKVALPENVKLVFDALASTDKSLETLEDADHWFYHTAFVQQTPRYTQEQRTRVVAAVAGWLAKH